jgi:UDP-N-acetylmuramoyl-L-alanyl-D-glutamate--2,6-diaminopimelate ligase
MLEALRRGARLRDHSGRVEPGDVFVALPGTRVRGTRYIQDAVARGASFVVSPELMALPDGADAGLVVRPDITRAMGELARIAYGTDQHRFQLTGITGTNGKTTVSYLIEHILKQAGKKVGIVGTIAYRWPGTEQEAALTTPGCLEIHELLNRMAAADVDAVCMEVSSHGLEQGRVAGLDFDVALFTNLTQDHLDYHQDMEAYFQSKRKLFFPQGTSRPRGVVNLDDPYGSRLFSELDQGLGFSLEGHGDERCLHGRITSLGREGLELACRHQNRTWTVQSRMIGRHNGSNILAAQALALELGLDPDAFAVIRDFAGVPGRLERIQNRRGLHVFVDYAHTPDALENVISSVRDLGFARVIVLFGCGGDRDRAKRPKMGRAVTRHADLAILTSDNPRHEDPGSIIRDVRPGLQSGCEVLEEPDRRKAIRLGLDRLGSEDILIVAGKGHEDTQQIGDQKIPFHDAGVVQELLGEA